MFRKVAVKTALDPNGKLGRVGRRLGLDTAPEITVHDSQTGVCLRGSVNLAPSLHFKALPFGRPFFGLTRTA